MHQLDGACLKIDRAKHHLGTLERSIHDFFDTKPYRVAQQNREGGLTYHIQLTAPLPSEWALIIGDVACNLRASLDYIVSQLSLPLLKGSTKLRDWSSPQFPICETPGDYSEGVSKRYVSFVPQKDERIIESLQPYHRGNWPELELLATLRDISNADKHRLLTPTISEVGLMVADGWPKNTFCLNQDDQGFVTIIADEGANISNNFKPSLTQRVILNVIRDKSMTPQLYSLDILWDIHKFIRDEVIPRFTGCFPK